MAYSLGSPMGAGPGARRFISFGLVGVAAFLVDAAVLHIAVELAGLSPYSGRAVSFLSAATAAWAMNRQWTFRASAGDALLPEWGRYLIANSLGAMINLGVYTVLVAASAFFYGNPVLAVGVGSLAGMIANFTTSKRFVFRGAGASR